MLSKAAYYVMYALMWVAEKCGVKFLGQGD